MNELQEKAFSNVAAMTGYSNQEVQVIANNVAKGANEIELAYFLNVCKTVELNPFNKEVWCYKDKRQNLIIFTGRDGMLTNAQKRPAFNGIRSVEFCKNDDILEIDIPNGKVNHKFDPRKDRGPVLGAYTFVFRKNGEPTIEVAMMSVYDKGYNTWKTHPVEMIKKVSETHALKKAFGFSGVQSEYNWDVSQSGIATPIQAAPESEERTLGKKILVLFETYEGDDKEELREMCKQKQEDKEFTIEFANNTIATLEANQKGGQSE